MTPEDLQPNRLFRLTNSPTINPKQVFRIINADGFDVDVHDIREHESNVWRFRGIDDHEDLEFVEVKR